ncbi:MAG: bifunctional folylpolyglutamate synthase/dihydrofolate synthase [Oscillospiraceae bacterium]|nr:bifunctional folylpolyglutamate synthase/dihydrofolate synthase [Oscillospiraceae bacterium]
MKQNNSPLSLFSAGGKRVSDLSRFTALCDMLGNPQNDLKFIHIAGTNGKGSVCEYLSCALIEAGFKTGKFTSPYIYTIHERIQLQNRYIPKKDFDENLQKAAGAALNIGGGDSPCSQFEVLTAAAFLYYKKKKADIVVLETGIGGLLDCTNIITPEISVITAIGYDHSDILGEQLSEIAAHKAGIIKERPCVMYPVQERAAYVEIRRQCEKTGAELIIPDTDSVSDEKISVYGNDFTYKGEKYHTAMGGRHQILNALAAIEALCSLGINSDCIKKGIKKAQVPARLQIIRKNPLVVLDGAHNRQGIAASVSVFENWRVRKAVVFGALTGKDYIGALAELTSFAHCLVLTDGFAENAINCADLYRSAVLLGFDGSRIYTVGEPRRAVHLAAELCGGGMVLVTGSLRLASQLTINN